MQEHKFGKSQPENVAFLKRVRKLLNEFPGTTTVGEVGDSHVGLQLMGEYTSGGDKLHMAYTFDMLGQRVHRRAFPRQDEAVLRRQSQTAGRAGAFPTTTSIAM